MTSNIETMRPVIAGAILSAVAEDRIATLEAENDRLAARVAELEAQIAKAREQEIDDAVAVEREACAQVCDEHALMATNDIGREWSESCAEAIRARGKHKKTGD